MSRKPMDSSCFLCGQDAIYRKTDFGNRRAHKCTNTECGEYEITNKAMKRLDGAAEFKEKAKQNANACRDTDKILEIKVSDEQKVIANLISR